MKHTVLVITHAHVLQGFYTMWVRGVACQKQRLGPKLAWSGLGKHPKNWDPILISATVEASNFKFGTQLRFGTSLPKSNDSGPKLVGLVLGGIRKHWDPLFISATIEARDRKIGTQQEWRFTLPNTSFTTKPSRVWIRRVPLPSPLWWWICNPSKTDGYYLD